MYRCAGLAELIEKHNALEGEVLGLLKDKETHTEDAIRQKGASQVRYKTYDILETRKAACAFHVKGNLKLLNGLILSQNCPDDNVNLTDYQKFYQKCIVLVTEMLGSLESLKEIAVIMNKVREETEDIK